jgi:hypothetical protein
MNTSILINAQDVQLRYSHSFKGRGGWHINCEVTPYMEDSETFTIYATCSQFIDELSELDSWEDKQALYHENFFYKFEYIIATHYQHC